MADFIERGDAFDAVMGQFCASSDETEAALNGAIEDIRKIPAADVRPVVRGRWVLDCGGVKCTACGEYPEKKDQCYTPFCCLCGAKMDGGQDDA